MYIRTLLAVIYLKRQPPAPMLSVDEVKPLPALKEANTLDSMSWVKS